VRRRAVQTVLGCGGDKGEETCCSDCIEWWWRQGGDVLFRLCWVVVETRVRRRAVQTVLGCGDKVVMRCSDCIEWWWRQRGGGDMLFRLCWVVVRKEVEELKCCSDCFGGPLALVRFTHSTKGKIESIILHPLSCFFGLRFRLAHNNLTTHYGVCFVAQSAYQMVSHIAPTHPPTHPPVPYNQKPVK
jgi:hypothetical protein